ncbi:unnamed protein product [Schistosoma margrebowiei]|uniref:Uncharacterized protein n=1 Tax=Schistosoma margrebowiei TaxID=48269 RepID=A0A183LE18_9TREM|nr:unnamed protein product [Schistosoma margrebowiei]
MISRLHSELENDCSLHESSTNRISNDTVAIHDPPSGPEMSNSETYLVVGLNPTVPETSTDSEVSSSQEDPLVLRENMSHASNNSQDPSAVLSHADYHGDQLSTNENFKKFDDNVPEDSNSDDFKLNGVYPHYLVSLTRFPVQYVLNAVKLIVIWVYEDPKLFRGGGWTRKILKSGSLKKGRCWDTQKNIPIYILLRLMLSLDLEWKFPIGPYLFHLSNIVQMLFSIL